MKKIKNIIILIGLFIIALISILLVFTNNIKNIRLKNKTKEIINYVYKIEGNNFYYNKGVLYNESNEIVTTDYYINGSGSIYKDKYNNMKISLKLEDRCIYKSSLGKVAIKKTCPTNIDLTPSMNKNNSQVTFKFKDKIDSYMISKKDDFNGEWKTINKESLVLNMFEEGKYYIWFKDYSNNISSAFEFDIECMQTMDSDFDNNMLYCAGSVINIDKEKWIVINENNEEITLMKYDPIYGKYSHNKEGIEYKWSTSLINKYLNEVYIETLNDNIKDKLVSKEICDTPSGIEGCDSKDGCGGYKKETIEHYKWKCDTYTKSKVRLISYDEYSTLYDSLEDRTIIYGSYWTINSYKESGSGISILVNGDVFVNEKITSELDIKPVITISR